jgi:hypothetical protein
MIVAQYAGPNFIYPHNKLSYDIDYLNKIMGTGGPFPGGKARPGRDADYPLHLVPRS